MEGSSMSDFDFVGSAYTAQSIYQDDQELINWYTEIDPTKQDSAFEVQLGRQVTRGVVALYPTPGLVVKAQLGAGEVRGMRTLSGGNVLIAACGNKAYKVNADFTFQVIGALESDTGLVSITDNGLESMLFDGENRYSYNMQTGIYSIIAPSDGAFQGGVTGDCVDNYIIYNKPDSQQWAATDALSSVTQPLSFSSKDGSPDNLVSLIGSGRVIYLLGEKTSESWIDVGTFPFPFQRIPGSNQQHGCVAAGSVARLGDSFAFLGQDDRGQNIAVINQGYGFIRISNHAVENDLYGQVVSDARGYSYQAGGHEFFVLNFPTADKTWVYDLTTKDWHKWLSTDDLGQFHRHRSNCSAFFQGLNLVGDYETGSIYSLERDAYTDAGRTIKRVRRCPHIVSDFRRQYFDTMQIQFQPGVGLSNGQGSDPQAMLRWSNDGGATWSSEHWKSIGAIGMYKNRCIWRRIGSARDRIFEVSVTDPINAVIVSANLEASGADN